MLRFRTVLFIIVGAFALVACGGGDDAVGVELVDFEITPEETSLPAGEVSFDVHNDANQVHEFVVARTDLQSGDLPTGDDGNVSEETDQLEVVDEIEDIEGGASPTLTVDLAPGHYVLFCNLPGHYQQGMHADLTVTGG
jgi:uncharacterized cupredoxin-like copper-binding protein